MKKFFTLLLVIALSVSFTYAQKKIAYVTLGTDAKKEKMVEWALPLDNDVIIQLLNQDANIDLTVFLCDGDGIDLNTSTTVDLSGFDAIIAQETFGSGDNVWKVGYPLHIATLPAPTVYNKIYSFRSGRGIEGGDGASVDDVNVWTLAVDAPAHDIFKAIEYSGSVIEVVKGGAHDTGDTGEKAMQHNTGNVVEGAIMLGHPEGVTDAVLALDEFPAGTKIDGYTVPHKVISFNFNYGQLSYIGDDNSGINLTEAGLTIWRNAIYIVAGLPVPDSPASAPTSVSSPKVDKINVYAVQGGIQIPVNSNVSVYSISGQLIKTEVNTNFVSVKPGIYVVTSENGVAKVAVNR